jgi:hypothetical protein
MKIKTTTTKTETKELEVSLPAFTKVKEPYCTSYYFVQSENRITRFDKYNHSGIKSFSQIGNVRDAFASGFEYISEQEFIDMYQVMINEVRLELNQIKLDLVQLQLDAKAEQERAEYFEYQDNEISEREEIIED